MKRVLAALFLIAWSTPATAQPCDPVLELCPLPATVPNRLDNVPDNIGPGTRELLVEFSIEQMTRRELRQLDASADRLLQEGGNALNRIAATTANCVAAVSENPQTGTDPGAAFELARRCTERAAADLTSSARAAISAETEAARRRLEAVRVAGRAAAEEHLRQVVLDGAARVLGPLERCDDVRASIAGKKLALPYEIDAVFAAGAIPAPVCEQLRAGLPEIAEALEGLCASADCQDLRHLLSALPDLESSGTKLDEALVEEAVTALKRLASPTRDAAFHGRYLGRQMSEIESQLRQSSAAFAPELGQLRDRLAQATEEGRPEVEKDIQALVEKQSKFLAAASSLNELLTDAVDGGWKDPAFDQRLGEAIASADPALAKELEPAFRQIGSVRNAAAAIDKVFREPSIDGMGTAVGFLAEAKILPVEFKEAETWVKDFQTGKPSAATVRAVASAVGLPPEVGAVAGLAMAAFTGDMSGVTASLGLPKEVGAAASIALGVFTGNPMAAISGLGGLFGGGGGGGGGDSAALGKISEQLAQIQETLTEIVQTLDRIEGKIDTLISEVRENHAETMALLKDIEYESRLILTLQAAQYQHEARACASLEEFMEGRYVDVRERFEKHLFGDWADCEAFVLRTASQPSLTGDLLYLARRQRSLSSLRAFAEAELDPAFAVFTSAVTVEKQPSALSGLLAGSSTVEEAERNWLQVVEGPDPLTSDRPRLVSCGNDAALQVLDGSLDTLRLLDPEAAMDLAGQAWFVDAYGPLVNEHRDRLAPPSCLRSRSCMSRRAEEYKPFACRALGGALVVVNTALAQQRILSGDYLVAPAEQVISTPGAITSSMASSLLTHLRLNEVLAHNVNHLMLRKSQEALPLSEPAAKRRTVGKAAMASTAYAFSLAAARHERGPGFLEQLFTLPELAADWKYSFARRAEPGLEDRCDLRLGASNAFIAQPKPRESKQRGSTCIALPDPDQYSSGRLNQTEVEKYLAAERGRLLERVVTLSGDGERTELEAAWLTAIAAATSRNPLSQ